MHMEWGMMLRAFMIINTVTVTGYDVYVKQWIYDSTDAVSVLSVMNKRNKTQNMYELMHNHNHHFMCHSQESDISSSKRQRRTIRKTDQSGPDLAHTRLSLSRVWVISAVRTTLESNVWKNLFHNNKQAVILRATKPAMEPGLLQAPPLWPEVVLSTVCRLCCHPTGQVDLRTATPDWTQRWREPTNTTWMTLYNSSRWVGGLSLCQRVCA